MWLAVLGQDLQSPGVLAVGLEEAGAAHQSVMRLAAPGVLSHL